MSEKAFKIEDAVLDDIHVTYAVVENKVEATAILDSMQLDISYGFESGMNVEYEAIKITFWSNVQAINAENEKLPLQGQFSIDFIFTIPGLESYVTRKENQLFVAPDILVSLANVSYSTARGIVYTHCQDTPLQKVILPILPTNKVYDFFVDKS